MQVFVLDPVGPLINVLHRSEDDTYMYSVEVAHSDLTEALHLMRNALAQISRTCRKKVLKALNLDIQDLAREDELYKNAAPNLLERALSRR